MSILVSCGAHEATGTRFRRVEINRPASANALDVATLRELWSAIAQAGSDPAVQAIVIGAVGGRHFCAGADLREPRSAQRAADFRSGLGLLLEGLFQIEKPVVAAVDGAASGAGAMIACVADRSILAADTFLCFPEIDASIPPLLAFELLNAAVGVSVARDWVATGRRIEAAECLQRGIVSEIAPRRDIKRSAEMAAAVLASKSKEVFARFKQHLAHRYVPLVERALAGLA